MTQLRQHLPARRKPLSEINVVPYIDVMLVLLLIFMVTAPLLTEGVKVDLPAASAKPLSKQEEPIIVTVNKRGEYFLNLADKPQQPLALMIIANNVAAEMKQSNYVRPVLVKGDKQVPYEKVMAAMVALQQAGVEEVGLVTDPVVTS